MINSFTNKYFFLSNFYPVKVIYNGIIFLNSEAAYQSQKVESLQEQQTFSSLNPSQAKKKGRHVKLREDWEKIKDQIMYEICFAKFTQNENLKEKLLNTGNEELVEGNNWGDMYWGKVGKRGRNKLGKILMKIREELK